MTQHAGTSENDWEQFAKEILGELSWTPVDGQSIAPGSGECQGWDDLVLKPRLLDALRRFNPDVYLQQACEEIVSPRSDDPISENHRIHDREFPMAFRFAVLTVVSDGIHARYGTPFTPLHHFAPWNIDDDGAMVSPGSPGADGEAVTGLELVLHGVFNQDRFLQLLRWFTAFDEGAGGLAKRIAKPHQYFAVAKAVGSTIEAVRSDGKAGVVRHTQGSGKSMEMELYRTTGGIYFTTLQKFGKS